MPGCAHYSILVCDHLPALPFLWHPKTQQQSIWGLAQCHPWAFRGAVGICQEALWWMKLLQLLHISASLYFVCTKGQVLIQHNFCPVLPIRFLTELCLWKRRYGCRTLQFPQQGGTWHTGVVWVIFPPFPAIRPLTSTHHLFLKLDSPSLWCPNTNGFWIYPFRWNCLTIWTLLFSALPWS